MESSSRYFSERVFLAGNKKTAEKKSHSDEEVVVAATKPKKRAGRRVFKETRHPIYRGVRRRNNDKWVCEVREPKTQARIWLGTYPTPEMAARAHDVAALALRGKSACFNFADSAWRLSAPASLSPKDIRAAAAEAAEEFRLTETEHNSFEKNCCAQSRETETEAESETTMFYLDEEAVFDMPRLVADMAQGLLLPPPPNDSFMEFGDDDVEFCDDVELWSYSI